MTMRGFETVGVRAVIQGLPEYLAGAKAITQANIGIGGSLKSAEGLGASFKLLGAAVATVTAAIGTAAVASAAKYETSLAKIDALTKTTTEDTERLGAGLLKMAKSVPKSPEELGAAAYFALSSGIEDVDEALALVGSAAKASAAGLGSTADIVDIVTAAMNAYGKENLTAAKATDILVAAVREGKGEPAAMAAALGTLLPIAAALKIPFEDLAAIFASLTNALGGSGAAELAATQLRGIMSQIISPSKEAKNALAEQEAGVRHLTESEIELADAHRAVVSATEGFVQAQRGVRDAGEGIVQAQRGVRDALQGVSSAQRDSRSATEALRNAYADLAAAQRNQQQASLDGRRETLSVLEAEQGLRELRTQAGSHALEVAAAENALAQAREQASSKEKKTASEARSNALAISQAELRLQQVRAQGPRYNLDLQNAELRLSETRLRVGSAQKTQDKQVADAQKNIVKSAEDVTAARRAEIKAAEAVSDAQRGLRNAYEGQGDAQRGVARASADLALAQEKELLAQIHTRDAYADLRKEIAEKGLVPTLQRLNDLFANNQEGLAKLFPDVRAFTGFLSAITSQGAATASILDRVKKSAGITDEAFARMSKTTAFQSSLLKNQLNVGLIQLGSVALPSVTAALGGVMRSLPGVVEGFKSIATGVFNAINSINTNTIGQVLGGTFKDNYFAGIVESAKKAGTAVMELGRLFKLGLDGGEIGGDIGAIQEAVFNFGAFIRETVIPAFNDAAAAVRLFFLGLAGGEVGGNISDLQTKLFELGATVRQQWLEVIRPAIVEGAMAIRAAWENDIRPALTAFADIIATTASFINEHWSEIRSVLKVAFDSIVESAKSAIEIFGNVLTIASEVVQGIDHLIHGEWSEAWESAKTIVSTAFDIIKKIVEDSPATLSKLFLDLGVAVAKAALDAGISVGKAFGNGVIDQINRMLNSLGGRVIIPAIRIAGREVSPEVKTPQINNPIPRLAKGDIVDKPTFAMIGEAGPEAVLPLTNMARSRAILGALPEALLASMLGARRLEDGGTFGTLGSLSGLRNYSPGFALLSSLGSSYGGGGLMNATGGGEGGEGGGGGESAPIGYGGYGGGFQSTTGGGSYGGGESAPIGGYAPRQVYATLPPSLVRSMTASRSGGGTNVASVIGGDVVIGSTSREIEELTVSTIRSIFSRARTQTAIGGGLITSGLG
jgi:hypothetical protein